MIKTRFLILFLITLASNSFSQHTNFFTYTGGEYADGIDTTRDGGYIVHGRTGYSPIGSNFVITKIDKFGAIQWQYTNNQFNGSDGDNRISKIIEDWSGNYVCVGGIDDSIPPYGNNSMIVKLDSLGGLIWNKQFDMDEGEGFGTINLEQDSTYLIAGGAGSVNGVFSFVININALGDSLWMKKYLPDSGYFFQTTNVFKKSNINYLFGNDFSQSTGQITKAIYTLDNSYNISSRKLLVDTANLYDIIDNYISDTTIITFNKFKTANNSIYSKIDRYDLSGNHISSILNPTTFGSFQSDSTIVGITAPDTFGIGNFQTNSVQNYTSYDFSVFNHILFDHSTTDRNKNSLWCGRVDLGIGDMAYIARFADTSQVGIKEFKRQKESLFIYPNPVHDILNIKIPSSINKKTICKISIYNSLGQLFFSQLHSSNTQFQLDISVFPKGLYSCIIQNENNIKTSNFIVY